MQQQQGLDSKTLATQQQKYEQLVAEMKAEFAASRSSGGRSLFGNAKLLQPKRFSGDKRQTQETLHTWLFTFEEFMNLQNLPKELWSRMAGQHLWRGLRSYGTRPFEGAASRRSAELGQIRVGHQRPVCPHQQQ